jgi:hypothetical protein
MTEYLVEFYVSQSDSAAVARSAERTRRAVEELTREGTPVRYLRSIFVPEDETCFFLCEAGSAAAVSEAVRRAALPFGRIGATVSEPAGERNGGRGHGT